MKEFLITILIAVASAIAGGVINAYFGYFGEFEGRKKVLLNQIKQLQADLSTTKMRAEQNLKTVKSLTLQLEEKTNELDKKKQDLETLNTKYDRLINPKDGASFIIDVVDTSPRRNEKMSICDKIEIKLTASSIICKILRVTERGALMQISGCKKYHTENAARLEGDEESTYLLLKETPFKIIFSNRGCEDGFSSFDSEGFEVVSFQLVNFDINQQCLTLQYRRKIWK